MSGPRGLLRRGTGVLAALLLTALLLEAGTCAAVRARLLATPAPHHGDTGIWWGGHPQLGVWHRPGTTGRVEGACYSAEYRINSAGARDVERPRRAERPRAVVLGDSFLEGWGLPVEARVSNLLEEETGAPHLNFAMAHFGPYQELLAYREIASRYEHDAVLASVLPFNDFMDTDLELASELRGYPYRYRPYLVEGPEGWTRLDHREPPLRRLLRHHTYTFHAMQRALRALAPGGGPELDLPEGDRPYSSFYDFEAEHADRIEEILRRLARETGSRPLAVVLIPTQADLARYAVDGPSPLARRLRTAAERDGWHLVNLLPPMAEDRERFGIFFLPCDYHWNRGGNRVAARILRRSLEGVLYGPGGVLATPRAPPRSPVSERPPRSAQRSESGGA